MRGISRLFDVVSSAGYEREDAVELAQKAMEEHQRQNTHRLRMG